MRKSVSYRCLLGGLLLGGASFASAQPLLPPNFVVIFCDNLGYGDIEPFGSKVHRTPHLNRMSREGRRFTHFYVTAGVCTPSRASLLTGCYAQRIGMHNNPRDGHVLRPVSAYGLHPNEVTIAEILKQRGYATGVFGKWHLGDQPEFLPTRQGFDRFFGIPYSDDMTREVGQRIGKRFQGASWPELPLLENETVIEAPVDRDLLTKRCTEEAIRFIRHNKDKPFFVYIPQPMPGSTRAPFASPAFKGKSRNGAWGDAIEEIDWSTGQILDALVDLQVDDRTLIVWLSDNGAPLASDPHSPSRGTNRPLHGRGYTTAEGAFRSPTIMRWPGRVEPNTTCAELATTMDLLPTLAGLAGAAGLPVEIDGHDIRPLIFGQPGAKSPYDAFFYYQGEQLQAVRSGKWKLFLPLDSFRGHPHFKRGQTTAPALFDVVDDVGSTRNVAKEHPHVVQELMRFAQAARKDFGDRDMTGQGQREPGKISGQPQPLILPEQSALEMIDGVRGGRHWVNAPTRPPKSPQESLKSLQIEPGLVVQLVAAEPLVRDPVAIAFDRYGRLLVVEYGDYPTGRDDGGDPLSRVVYLEDVDHDGVADRRHVFADKLTFAHSLMPLDDGILVGAQTQILFLRDTDGDRVADVREVLFDGFTPAHPQMQIGNPRWGIDNWVYLNYGPGKITSKFAPNKGITIPRKDVRYHPETLHIEADSGLGQFGNTIDRWGHRFYCTNRNPIMTTLLPPAVLNRNPFAVISKGHYDVGQAGGDTRVYPLVEMKSNYLSHAGTHTSACGVTAYLGDLLGPDYANNVFVCEPIGHLVTRSIVEPAGLTLKARRARKQADFIASADTWFRPSSLANGPDGALYLADMYRLWVEHPKFLPPEVAAKLDWRAGEDRGRIYRIARAGAQPRPFRPPTDTMSAVALLEDPNGWRQFLGQRLLVRQQAKDAIPEVRVLLRTSPMPTGRLHALWTLDGLGGLSPDDLVRGLHDGDPHVRRDAVKLSATRLSNDRIFQELTEKSADPDIRVRFQVALALGETNRPKATSLLAALAQQDGHDPWFARGLLTSVESRAGAVLSALVTHEDFVTRSDAAAFGLVRQLSTIVGARGDLAELRQVLDSVGAAQPPGLSWRAAIVSGLGQGLPRHRGDLGRTRLLKLIDDPPEELATSVVGVREFLKRVQQTAVDTSKTAADRAAIIGLLAYRPFDGAASAFEELLDTGQPVDVQLAAVNAMAENGSEAAAEIILKRWEQLGPTIRQPALAQLLRRTSTARRMLQAMAAGKMRPTALDIDQRLQLLQHPDAKLKELASDLFGGAVSPNRRQVARQYQRALTLDGSAHAGVKVFEKACAKCHRIDGIGHETGPDISDVRNRSRAALLYDILDPNAKVEPRFNSYTVLTDDGRVFNGIIASETAAAVVLRMAEGKEQTVGRGEIEAIRASNTSLMPEGVEKDVSVQDMAHLLEFLKSRTH